MSAANIRTMPASRRLYLRLRLTVRSVLRIFAEHEAEGAPYAPRGSRQP